MSPQGRFRDTASAESLHPWSLTLPDIMVLLHLKSRCSTLLPLIGVPPVWVPMKLLQGLVGWLSRHKCLSLSLMTWVWSLGHMVEWESQLLSSGLYHTTSYPKIKKTEKRKQKLLGASPVCSIIQNWMYPRVTCPSVLRHTEARVVAHLLPLIGSCLRDAISEVSLMKCLSPGPYLFCSEPHHLQSLLVSPRLT